MTIQASVLLRFTLGTDTYDVKLSLPASTPTATAPFLFNVNTVDKDDKPIDNLLQVAVGASGQIYVAVAPPKSLLTAVAGDIVKELDVVVQDGKYDTATHTFTP